LKHFLQIKRASQIGGVQSTQSSWLKAGNDKESGAQIDLLIDRADQCINICEMKFSTTLFTIDKRYANELRNRLIVFRQHTHPRKSLFLTLITTYGTADGTYKHQLIDNEITMESLFD